MYTSYDNRIYCMPVMMRGPIVSIIKKSGPVKYRENASIHPLI